TLHGSASTQLYGTAVAGAGDVDGDGHADLLIGGTYFPNSLQSGMAQVRSGANGGVLFTWTGAASRDAFGSSVAGLGDVDGDGVPDVIVGAKQLKAGTPGYARVFSGATGLVLFHVVGDSTHVNFGVAVSGMG